MSPALDDVTLTEQAERERTWQMIRRCAYSQAGPRKGGRDSEAVRWALDQLVPRWRQLPGWWREGAE
ncbi:MAG TPA: hypothetical protein VFE48_25450 [Methylomirabilota bacterium]|nr:hypothetical protein [Methylomirabilota bacterium]